MHKIAIIEPDKRIAVDLINLLKKHFNQTEILLFSSGSDYLKERVVQLSDILLIACSLPDIEISTFLDELDKNIPVFILTKRENKTGDCLNLISRGLTGFIRLPSEEAEIVALIGIALQNRKLEKELLYQSRLCDLIRKLGSKFINIHPSGIDQAINESMAQIGEFTGVDRVYLFDYNLENCTSSNTHEWCAEGIPAKMENLKDLSVDSIPEWYNKHKNGEIILIHDVQKLKKSDAIRKILKPQGVWSVLSIPLFYEKECFGFVGFDSCKGTREWQTDEISVLQMFADLLINLQVKRKFENKLFQVESIYQFIAKNINDAVALIDIKGNYTFVSPSHKTITGRGEEVIGQYAFQFVHPEDRKMVFGSAFRVMRSDTEQIAEYRYLHPEKGYLWYETVLKRHFDNSGNIFGLFASRNIHERKLAEKELHETKSILQGILDNIPVRVFWKDRDLKYLGCNVPFAKDAGLSTPDEIPGKDDFEMPWKNEADLYRRDDNEVINSGKSKIGFEEPQTSFEGKTLWLRTSKVPLRNAEGKIIGVLGTYEDITQKKLLEDTLRHSEERYRTFIETSQDGISLMDMQGNILFCNQQKAEMIGLENSEKLIGTNALVLIHHDDRENMKRVLQELTLIDSITNLELRVIKRDGSFFFASFNVSLIRDDAGDPLYIIAFMQDITQRVQAQQALIAERDFANQVMNTMGQGLSVLNEKGLIEYVNQAHAKMLGLRPEDMIGRFPEDFVYPPDLYIIQNVQKHREKGSKSSYEIRLRHADKHPVHAWITGVPRIQDGRYAGSIVVISDISERIKTEEALRESEYRFQLLAEVAPVGIFRTDATGYTNYVNPKWCEISQMSFNQALGNGWLDAVHPEDRIWLEKGWSEATSSKLSSETEYRFLHSKGSITWVIGRAVPQTNKSGKIIGYIGTITDITERKKNEAILYESEEKYRLLFERNPAPMIIYEKESMKLLSVNDAFSKHYGYSRKETAGMFLSDLYSDRDKKPLATRVRKLMGFTHVGERHHVKKDGTLITVISSSHEMNYLGKNARVAVLTDITERKKIEKALRESEERFRRLAENADDAIYRIELYPEQRFSYVSPAITRLTGYTPEDHYSDPSLGLKLVHPDDRSLIENLTNNPDRIREPVTLRWIRKDGKVIWTEQKNVPVYDSKGKLIALEGISRDITLRKTQEEEITKLSVGMEQSPVIVMITDTKGNIEYVNQKFCDVTGYAHAEVMGKNPRMLKSGDKKPEDYNILWDTVLSGNEWRGEFRNRKKNGELYWESASISPIRNEKGEIAFFIAIKEDITERKKMEEELLAAKEKAEESDKLKTAFLNNMSHEIRTPLNAITGFSDLLNVPEVEKEEIAQYTSVIKQSSNQLLSIIDDIVNIATIEAGQVKILLQETNVNEVFKNIYNQLQIRITTKDLLLKIESFLPEEKSFVIADETKLTQVLSNLLVNAIKFTEKGLVKYGCKITGEYLEFHVSDTGIGIHEDLHDKIFERFRQSDLSISRKYGGTGLGLSISKSFVELMGGKIWLESSPGEGSVFYFTIPHKPVKVVKESDSEKEEIHLDSKRSFLIVEDEDFNFMLTNRILAEHKMNILRAVDGLEAVEICRNRSDIELVIMDIKIPGINGHEATRRIKAIRPDLPVIALTAYAQEGSREQAINSGCDEYLSKPFKKEELLEIVGKFLKD